MKPAVTVAIPTSNRLSLLRETLEDLLLQDYENLEILVSDNGSTDGTEDAVATMARTDERVSFRRNESPVPITAHFNQCLSAARGELFILLSDDDRINPTFVKGLAEALMQNPLAAVAIPANALIDETGTVTRKLPPPPHLVFEGVDFAIEWLWKTREMPVANLVTVMGYTHHLRKYRYQPFPMGLHSDDLLFLHLALRGQIVFRRDAVFYWRIHGTQQVARSSPHLVDQAGRKFRNFARKDRAFQNLVLSHHPAKQKLVMQGVFQMTAETYLHRIDFFRRPFDPRTLKLLASAQTNSAFLRLVLRHYYRRVRNRLPQEEAAAQL